jgi:hypothetical protein
MKPEDLKKGQCLLVSARGVKNGKVQLMFAEKITNPYLRPSSITGLLNKSDDRFNAVEEKARYAWETGEPADIQAALGIDVSGLSEGQIMEIGKLSPELGGEKLHIQITETTDGDDYDFANIETRAKRAGKDGDFILTSDGQYIFVNASVVKGEAKHAFFKDTTRSSEGASASDEAVSSVIGG